MTQAASIQYLVVFSTVFVIILKLTEVEEVPAEVKTLSRFHIVFCEGRYKNGNFIKV